MGRLDNQVAWVSGVNKGIGEGIARLCAKEGAKAAMSGRTVSEGEKIAQEIRDAGGEAFFFRCDVTKGGRSQQIRRFMIEKACYQGGTRVK